MVIMIIVLKLLSAIALAPLASGLIAKIKNNLRLRQGQGILQPYRDLWKLFGKEEIVPAASSWIFRVTPFVALTVSVTAILLLPLTPFGPGLSRVGDLLAIIFILALGRFFLALAALDAGSSFGGIGSSREMFIASFVEPAACLVVFTLYLSPGSPWSVAHLLAGSALLIIILAETARLPVDNQETHLELTMLHEAMLLDYSGPALALLELSAQIKQFFWLCLLVGTLAPLVLLPYGLSLLALIFAIALIEVGVAKYRLFKVPDLIVFSVILALLALVSALLGV